MVAEAVWSRLLQKKRTCLNILEKVWPYKPEKDTITKNKSTGFYEA